MAGVVGGPVLPLGSRVLASALTYRRSRVLYDYALATLPLLAATSEKYPYTRSTAQFRKEQFDNSNNPGEQTLQAWWLRSQSSFHEGAGIKFMEPANDDEVMNAFAESAGVDPWTPGQITLLKQAVLKNPASTDVLVFGMVENEDVYYQAEGATLARETASGSSAVTWGGAGQILSMTSDGAYIIVADNSGIYRSLGGAAGSQIWNTGSNNVVLGYPHQRLVAGIGPSIYELTTGGPTLPTPIYTHPSTSWKWTGITEGPTAIYASGYNGAQSAIYKFTLGTNGAMPTLTSGVVAAVMPTGERVHSIYAYIGSYIAIGTNKGVRIGTINDNGDISYGPLVIESTQPVQGFVGEGRFLYAACTNQIDGKSGLWRIDLGTPQNDGSFAYATDLNSGVTGAVNSVAILGASGRKVFGVSGAGSYLEHATDLVPSGYFRTGYIRFNTVEPKQFRYVTCRVTDADGSVGIETYDSNGTAVSVATIAGVDNSDFDMGRTSAEEYIGLRFTLNRDADPTKGPVMASWQVKALPAIKRSRQIQVPILLFEEMRDSKGAALPVTDIHAVLAQLEALEDAATPVLFAELGHNPQRTELVVIDEIRFQQAAPPAGRAKGEGGVLYLTLRTVL